jgi:hypothetical protein
MMAGWRLRGRKVKGSRIIRETILDLSFVEHHFVVIVDLISEYLATASAESESEVVSNA